MRNMDFFLSYNINYVKKGKDKKMWTKKNADIGYMYQNFVLIAHESNPTIYTKQ